MQERLRVALFGLLAVSAAHAADTAGCSVRKGLYESWLSLGKHAPSRAVKGAAPVVPSQPAMEAPSAQGIASAYGAFFTCLNDAAVPADDEGGRTLCKDAGNDRVAALVCETSLYLKTGRKASKDLLEALPATKKSAEMVWDLQSIAESGLDAGRYPAMFQPDGPGYKILDELFVLVLDDQDTAAAKYSHIAGSASGTAGKHVDAQFKILVREAPAVVVKQWASLRQHQARMKKVLAELATELPAGDLKKLRKGISGFCTPDNLDCPEIVKLFGRAE
jgi:hypothetical protein